MVYVPVVYILRQCPSNSSRKTGVHISADVLVFKVYFKVALTWSSLRSLYSKATYNMRPVFITDYRRMVIDGMVNSCV